MIFRRQLLAAIACAATLAPTLPAWAQGIGSYPDKPLTLIVPYPPGGAADQFMRPFAQALSQRIGQNVIVDNRPGANGNIGSVHAAKQLPADGYTLLLGTTSTLAINPHLYASMGYDPLSDLQPVTLTHQMPNVLLVNPNTPYRNVADVIGAAKSKPGSLAYGSAGNGNTMHLAGELFQSRSGARLMHVPYKGGAPALNDVMAGQIPMMFNNLPAVVQVHKAGKIRVLALATAKRSPLLPDVPTMAEAGLQQADSVVWNGVLMRKGTPAAIVDYLNREMRAVLESPAFRAPIEAQGFDVLSSTPKEFEAVLQRDHALMGELIKQNNIKIE
ncbi:MAG: tripartite tricarboxylate transporter substrate binding protein [Rhodoferax sp.]|nr:tripartite tricarboxylate transporter substrate binding protein [Rhodoferax sp.]MCB2030603.1 tripartite tricarboxylate transporter substrate binding protein [Rhodoferax sp.]MCP5260163.1 tripartite tricarboxylate transporter substrate binding protein [Rhodoferax sp.]